MTHAKSRIGPAPHAWRGLCLMCALALAWQLTRDNALRAQVQLADEIIIISQGLRANESALANTHLGVTPGAGAAVLGPTPGGLEPTLGEPAASSVTIRDPFGGLIARRSAPASEAIITPPPTLAPAQIPTYGPLELPTIEDEGPADGLTLDQAIDRLIRENLDLRSKFQELPQAQADILSAGLRGNPLIFASADDVPYGSYSPQRPGENTYGVTIIQPLDLNHKRKDRVLAAQRARSVLEAQYQDAVRVAIDNAYTAFIDVLASRQLVRYVETSLTSLEETTAIVERRIASSEASVLDLDRVAIQRDTARIALDEARAAHANALRALAAMMGWPVFDVGGLAVRGGIVTQSDPLPTADELVGIGMANRPDLAAYRLGVSRAQADARTARSEAIPDIFVLYSPYGFRNNVPTGGQNAVFWGGGVMASIPLFNRNQGNIRRAEINISQTRIELAEVERQIEVDIRQACANLDAAAQSLARLQSDILPRASQVRKRKLVLFQSGEESAMEYLAAQREYSDIVRQYSDALIRHRRAALRLNTAIAMRIIP